MSKLQVIDATKKINATGYTWTITIRSTTNNYGGAAQPNFVISNVAGTEFDINPLVGQRLKGIQLEGCKYTSNTPTGTDVFKNFVVEYLLRDINGNNIIQNVGVKGVAGFSSLANSYIESKTGYCVKTVDNVSGLFIASAYGVTEQILTNPSPASSILSFTIKLDFTY